jgi:tetratricopeptide (TPR) repeat protein
MRFFLLLIISSLITPLSFSQSEKAVATLYSNYLKGLYYLEQGKYSESLKELEKAKARDPQSIHIRLKIATALVGLERTDEAIAVLNEAKKIAPDNLDVSLALIFIYSYNRDDVQLEKEYEEFLKKAHELKPKDVGISEYLAQFYFYKNNPQEAIEIYERILETKPDYIGALFWLGQLYEEVGRRHDAITVWKKGLEIDPTYHLILNSLGYIYAVEGINLDEAESMIKKALEKEPQSGAYLDSLGWVYFKKGDLEKAEEYLVEAIGYTKDPEIYGHLGDLYIKLGDIDRGINYYEEGLQYFPDNKGLQSKIKEYEKKGKVPKK